MVAHIKPIGNKYPFLILYQRCIEPLQYGLVEISPNTILSGTWIGNKYGAPMAPKFLIYVLLSSKYQCPILDITFLVASESLGKFCLKIKEYTRAMKPSQIKEIDILYLFSHKMLK
jgi:hypothetical protein